MNNYKNTTTFINFLVEQKELSKDEIVLVHEEMIIIKTSNPEIIEILDDHQISYKYYEDHRSPADMVCTLIIPLK